MRVLVCGSRDFQARHIIAARIERLPAGTVVVHGDAFGADKSAGFYAAERGLTVEAWPADWKQHGRKAGILRNIEMLDTKPGLVIAFWDGKSKGTKHTIDEARRRAVLVEVIRQPVEKKEANG